MIFFIIGVVAALFALAVLLLAKEYKNSAIIPAVVAVVMIGISCVSYVPTGYTGIVTTFGKVEDGTKDAGIVFKQPWQSIVKMDNRVQEMSMDLSASVMPWCGTTSRRAGCGTTSSPRSTVRISRCRKWN